MVTACDAGRVFAIQTTPLQLEHHQSGQQLFALSATIRRLYRISVHSCISRLTLLYVRGLLFASTLPGGSSKWCVPGTVSSCPTKGKDALVRFVRITSHGSRGSLHHRVALFFRFQRVIHSKESCAPPVSERPSAPVCGGRRRGDGGRSAVCITSSCPPAACSSSLSATTAGRAVSAWSGCATSGRARAACRPVRPSRRQ